MKKVSIAQASGSLAKYAAELDSEIVVVTRGRRPLAALVPSKDVDREALALSTNPEFLAIIKGARAEIAAGRSVSLTEVRSRVTAEKKVRGSLVPRPAGSKRRR